MSDTEGAPAQNPVVGQNLAQFLNLSQSGLPFEWPERNSSLLGPRNRFIDNPVGTQSLSEQSLTNPAPGGFSPVIGDLGGVPATGPQIDRFWSLASEAAGASPITAYHGTPHLFSALDKTKIGTGEGAQAYGYGHYSAGNEDIARGYRDKLSRGADTAFADSAGNVVGPWPPDMTTPQGWALDFLNTYKGDYNIASSRLSDSIAEAQKYIRSMSGSPSAQRLIAEMPLKQGAIDELARMEAAGVKRKPPGNMYEMRLNVEPHQMLDWDTPLAEHHPEVHEALKRAGVLPADNPYLWREIHDPGVPGEIGHELYHRDDPSNGLARLGVKMQKMRDGTTIPAGDAVFVNGKSIGSASSVNEMKRMAEERVVPWEIRSGMDRIRDTGELTYRNLVSRLDNEAHANGYPPPGWNPHAAAAERLRDAGIPGIQYYDGSSRAAARSLKRDIARQQATVDNYTGKIADIQRQIDNPPYGAQPAYVSNRQGQIASLQATLESQQAYLAQLKSPNYLSRNYVMFPGNEHLVDILRRYAVPGMVGAGAGAAAGGTQQQ